MKARKVGSEVFAIMTPERARALEAVAKAAERGIRNEPRYCSGELVEEEWLPLDRALSRLARVSGRKGKR